MRRTTLDRILALNSPAVAPSSAPEHQDDDDCPICAMMAKLEAEAAQARSAQLANDPEAAQLSPEDDPNAPFEMEGYQVLPLDLNNPAALELLSLFGDEPIKVGRPAQRKSRRRHRR